jgi:hypothetical protein
MFLALIVTNSFDVEELSTAGLTCMFGMFIFGILNTQVFRGAIPGMILLTVAGKQPFRRHQTTVVHC